MKNILVVSSYYLSKDTRFGGTKRLYYLVKELERYGTVYVICHDGCEEYRDGIVPGFDRFLFLPVEDDRNLFEKIVRPGWNIERFLGKNAGRIREFLDGAEFDAALLAFPLALAFVTTLLPKTVTSAVYLEDDLLSETIRAQKRRAIFDPYRAVRLAQMRSYYTNRLARLSAFVAISAQEAQVVRGLFPGVTVATVGYGVPIPNYPFLSVKPHPFTVGFIGNFRHVPNADAAKWFLESVYRECKKRIPNLKALLAGKDIPQSLRDLTARDGSVAWEEDMASVRDFYEKTSVLINPIVSGRGLRTKIVEAAAFGRPIVSTALGAEGLASLKIDIADTPAEFADCCARLASDEFRYADIAAANRRTAEREFSVETVGGRLAGILQGMV
jgi:glycosyltransferase involved in cell wall biosynthesis